ncbi:unnamed protein product [Cladocopium goreaui]|uniref:Uncharacterized protein n=1 Tax=Cladocopium goreaui TaxID=2562237 RepID=A0A9P1CGL5_9DINO|nr:unnamed protein product [Cladocopium goreaui]CAI3990308.1 unnamed protein product [Cladocopium goreaui]|mmetsp:Transcript_26401/g.57766  ORF Transcript_26401/g.57766 Transcript_26401/m.57766 type:complete len:138 (-) Transcript_26401:48-461(-)
MVFGGYESHGVCPGFVGKEEEMQQKGTRPCAARWLQMDDEMLWQRTAGGPYLCQRPAEARPVADSLALPSMKGERRSCAHDVVNGRSWRASLSNICFAADAPTWCKDVHSCEGFWGSVAMGKCCPGVRLMDGEVLME